MYNLSTPFLFCVKKCIIAHMRTELNAKPNGQLFFWNDLATLERDESSTSLYNIPSDNNGRFTLDLGTLAEITGDIIITMRDKIVDDNWAYVKGVRLRGEIGGGFNPFITDGFMSILGNFGKAEFEFDNNQTHQRDRINSNSNIDVVKGEEPKLSVIGIQDDDGEDGFIDIFLLNNGDVILRLRNEESVTKAGEIQRVVGEMLFKTKDNGGKNPIIAETLTKLADRIAGAKR